MRKQKTDTLDSFWKYIRWILIVFLFIIILFNTGIIYVKINYGISNSQASIFDIDLFSNLLTLRNGDYIDFYRWNEDRFVTHKIIKVYNNEVITTDFIGENESVSKENIVGKRIIEIPIIRLSGRNGFIIACNFQNYVDNLNQDCDYLYCTGVLKRSQEDCEK